MNTKIPILLALTILSITLATSQLEFKTEEPIDFRSNLDLNDNKISNLSDPTKNQDAATFSWTNTNFLYRDNPQLRSGNLNLDGGNLRLSKGYISNDGDNEGIKIQNNGNIQIKNGNLNLSENEITNLPPPQTNQQPLRLQEGSDYLNRTGDTLSGNLSFNNQYYITNLKNPENPQDAATKSYVQTYADNNDQNTQLSETDVENYIFDTGDNTGNLGLNGGEIVDNSGPITLGGGGVNIPDGNIQMGSNEVSFSSGGAMGNTYNVVDGSNTFLDRYRNDGSNEFILDYHPGSSLGIENAGTGRIINFNQDNSVDIPRGNLNLDGNKLEGAQTVKAGSEMCIGQHCN